MRNVNTFSGKLPITSYVSLILNCLKNVASKISVSLSYILHLIIIVKDWEFRYRTETGTFTLIDYI